MPERILTQTPLLMRMLSTYPYLCVSLFLTHSLKLSVWVG
jgi:hypothetical protein